MRVNPGESVGPISFKMNSVDIDNLLGESIRTLEMSHDRVMKVFAGDIDTVILHPDHGLVSVSVSSAPLLLKDTDIMGMDGEQLLQWCKSNSESTRETYQEDELTEVSVDEWGITVYLQEQRPDSAEISIGRWDYGELVDING